MVTPTLPDPLHPRRAHPERPGDRVGGHPRSYAANTLARRSIEYDTMSELLSGRTTLPPSLIRVRKPRYGVEESALAGTRLCEPQPPIPSRRSQPAQRVASESCRQVALKSCHPTRSALESTSARSASRRSVCTTHPSRLQRRPASEQATRWHPQLRHAVNLRGKHPHQQQRADPAHRIGPRHSSIDPNLITPPACPRTTRSAPAARSPPRRSPPT